MAAVSSEELRTVLGMSVILITTNFKVRNRSTWSKGPIKRAGKVCGDFQDLKSPGYDQNLFQVPQGVSDCFVSQASRSSQKTHIVSYSIDDNAKGGLTQFKELFTVIPCAPRDFKR